MAMDIVESGGDLGELLEAGGWKSSAFAVYLDRRILEMRAAGRAQRRAAKVHLRTSENVESDHSSDSEGEDVPFDAVRS